MPLETDISSWSPVSPGACLWIPSPAAHPVYITLVVLEHVEAVLRQPELF